MDKWEYLTIDFKPKQMSAGKGLFGGSVWDTPAISDQFNEYGQQGWELVGFFYNENSSGSGSWGTDVWFASFKRKI